MKYKIALTEAVVVVVAWLIITMPAAYATQVSVLWGGEIHYTADMDQRDWVIITKSVNSNRVTINVTNTTPEYDMEYLYLFKCKGKNPTDCVSQYPGAPDTNPNVIYDWDELASASGIANILFLVKLATEDFSSWVGFWHTIEKVGSEYVQTESSLGSMEASASLYDYRYPISTWASERFAIPFNWLGSPYAVLEGVSKLYKISTDDFSSFQSEAVQDDSITSLDNNFLFAFPESATGDIMNPVTFYSNPLPVCGDGACEVNDCCYDCGCPSSQYCDTAGGTEGVCRVNNMGLEVTKVTQTSFSDCNTEHELEITVRVKNPPTGLEISGQEYRLDGAGYTSSSCENLGGYYYRCPVTVPALPFGSMPECGTGAYTISSNRIKFNVRYYDGPSLQFESITTSFSDILLGSYVCGNGACEGGLGESADNCCYDCACKEGQYCDSSEPVDGADLCRTKLSDSSLSIISVSPVNFNPSEYGEPLTIGLEIDNAPSTLNVRLSQAKCSMDCSYVDNVLGQSPCDASCDATCTGSLNGGVHESECTIEFSITNPEYDAENSYTLTPEITYPVLYSDGSRDIISGELSVTGGSITIGASYCGDGNCDPEMGEDSSSCCYDCGCAEGEYCDTEHREWPSESDQCLSEEGISLEIANMHPSPASFADYAAENEIIFDARINNPPSGMDYGYSCVFGDGSDAIQCGIACSEEEPVSDNILGMSCSITLDLRSGFDYESSGFYDPATKIIRISPALLKVSLDYNNGPAEASKELSAPLGEIKMDVISHCGSGAGYRSWDSRCDPHDREAACESELGENEETCCCDCGCEGYGENSYCYYNPDDLLATGVCSYTSGISLAIDSVTPDPAVCCIDNYQTGCMFVTVGGECAGFERAALDPWSGGLQPSSGVTVKAHITNPPADLRLSSGNYHMKINGEEQAGFGGVHCFADQDEGFGHYKCMFNLAPIDTIQEGTEEKDVELLFTVHYTIGGEKVTQELSAGTSFSVERQKTEVLKDREDEIEDLESKISRMNTIKNIVYAILVIGAGICASMCIWDWGFCKLCWIIYACVASALLTALTFVNSHVNNYKSMVNQLNAEIGNTEDAMEQAGQMEQLGTAILGAAAGVACMVGIFMGGNPGTAGAAGAGSGPTYVPEAPPGFIWT